MSICLVLYIYSTYNNGTVIIEMCFYSFSSEEEEEERELEETDDGNHMYQVKLSCEH